MGPSRPADPPVPSVTAEEKVLITAIKGEIGLFNTIALITSGTPCPLADLKISPVNPTINPPIAGMINIL